MTYMNKPSVESLRTSGRKAITWAVVLSLEATFLSIPVRALFPHQPPVTNRSIWFRRPIKISFSLRSYRYQFSAISAETDGGCRARSIRNRNQEGSSTMRLG